MTGDNNKQAARITAEYDGKRFSSSAGPGLATGRDVLRWVVTRKAQRWPRWMDNPPPSPLVQRIEGQELRLTFINHATVLIQAEGINILTDPVFAYRVSPVRFAGPRRHRAPGLSLENLPVIDAVVISHTHFDHLDLVSLRSICERDQPQLIAPLKTAKLVGGLTSRHYTELNWWETTRLQCGLDLTFVPALHWTSRKLGDENTSLWGGYVLAYSDGPVYFAGDTGFGDGALFEQIADEFPNLRCALLPIGAYEPRWFMRAQHMNPAEAIDAFQALSASYALGIHHGTFQLTDEAHEAPISDLTAALSDTGIPSERFRTLDNGQAWDVPAR